jgi:hypothetical protein
MNSERVRSVPEEKKMGVDGGSIRERERERETLRKAATVKRQEKRNKCVLFCSVHVLCWEH